jgi:hypothetical protein
MWVIVVKVLRLNLGLTGTADRRRSCLMKRPRRPLRCLLGWHRWRLAFNADNEKYLRCSRCGKEGEEGLVAPLA